MTWNPVNAETYRYEHYEPVPTLASLAGAVVELYLDADGTLKAEVRIPAPAE